MSEQPPIVGLPAPALFSGELSPGEYVVRVLAMLLVKDGKRPEAIALLEEGERLGAGTEQTRAYLERITRKKGAQ